MIRAIICLYNLSLDEWKEENQDTGTGNPRWSAGGWQKQSDGQEVGQVGRGGRNCEAHFLGSCAGKWKEEIDMTTPNNGGGMSFSAVVCAILVALFIFFVIG